MIEQLVNIDRMEHALALFGSFDENVRLIEQEYKVTVTCRGSEIKVFGDEEGVSLAVRTITGLLNPVGRCDLHHCFRQTGQGKDARTEKIYPFDPGQHDQHRGGSGRYWKNISRGCNGGAGIPRT